jgi:hypothetical protein
MNIELKGTWAQVMTHTVALLTAVHSHNTRAAQAALGDLAVLLRHVNTIERRESPQKQMWGDDDA